MMFNPPYPKDPLSFSLARVFVVRCCACLADIPVINDIVSPSSVSMKCVSEPKHGLDFRYTHTVLLLQLHPWRDPPTSKRCSPVEQNMRTSDMCTGGRAEKESDSSEIRGVAIPS